MAPILPLVLCAGLGFSACGGMNDTQQRTLTGAGAGAAGGAIIGVIAGNVSLGAVTGAGAGATGGYLYDKYKKSGQRSFAEDHMAGLQSNPR